MNTFTNSMHNRNQAIRLLKAGFTVKQICDEFPLVWFLEDGKLAQIYDNILSDGRKETKVSMSSLAVSKLILKRNG